MASSRTHLHSNGSEFDYLGVDDFIETLVEARALATAFELGLVDYLSGNQPITLAVLEKEFVGDSQGLQLLLNVLNANQVIEKSSDEIRLSRQFERVLPYRDLLEAKLEFADLVVPDLVDLFANLIRSPNRFSQQARILDLFGYHRCFDYSPESYELTKRWMRITTALTKYEAPVCMKYHDFSRYHRILDVGGNSGEFVLQICKSHPNIQATVFDLPLVCQVGEEHIHLEPEADRISFVQGNALTDVLPKGFDLIAFKSMLHDWPEKEAGQFVTKASHSLDPGGTLLIFERGPFEIGETTVPYSMIPFLLFFRSFRAPTIYEEMLKELNFQDIKVEKIDLEMPFYLVTATKR